MPAEKKELFLTFDDGPVPGPTEFVLETLKRFEIKATFFCIGDNIRKHPAVFKAMLAGGHTVGNHTFNHLNGWKTGTLDYVENINACNSELVTQSTPLENTGANNIFRPPYGRITRDQIRALNNYRIIMWDVLSVDYNHKLSDERCLRNTISSSRPGSIVVFHDSYKAEKNLTFALPRFIEHFLSLGFKFNVISE